ncbi:hypothetical protein [Sagittula salina]|uniref:Uncharacterized protein n=1 Tax=Sagittula salina TaxID=2820268 RepID=A0A940MU04_9RHOB|nr:hypothetical protein [Sagittula salina]MBP0483927.1 hypothetical protein [Sagittula salina]
MSDTTTDALEHALGTMFETAEDNGKQSLTVSVQDLHNAGESDGDLPGDAMARAEQVLREAMRDGDTAAEGEGFAVRFGLPRT